MTDLIKRLDLLLRRTARSEDRMAISHTHAKAVREAILKIEALTAEVQFLRQIAGDQPKGEKP